MYLSPSRLQETSRWLDAEWKSWKERYQGSDEPQLREMFLSMMEAVGSSIDRAYIEEWDRRQQENSTS